MNNRYEKIKDFLTRTDFNGFTKDDLFIMAIIKKGWGHDIAAYPTWARRLQTSRSQTQRTLMNIPSLSMKL